MSDNETMIKGMAEIARIFDRSGKWVRENCLREMMEMGIVFKRKEKGDKNIYMTLCTFPSWVKAYMQQRAAAGKRL